MHKELMSKAIRAAASARTLLAVGDADGASNRAYYAMFDAARAALWVSGVNAGKTHRGILNAFHEQLIKTEKLPVEMGRLLSILVLALRHQRESGFKTPTHTPPSPARGLKTSVP